MEVTVTPILISSIAGVFLATLFDWCPGVKTWYDDFSNGQKRGIMAGCVLFVTLVLFLLGCGGVINIGYACQWPGFLQYIQALIAAVVANQGWHQIAKP